jgi:hypothetical protein
MPVELMQHVGVVNRTNRSIRDEDKRQRPFESMMAAPMQEIPESHVCGHKQRSADDLPSPSCVNKETCNGVRFPERCRIFVSSLLRRNAIAEQCADFNASERQVHRVTKPMRLLLRDGLRSVCGRRGLLCLCGCGVAKNKQTPVNNRRRDGRSA